MHIEKRIVGKRIKYYLAHTYRDEHDRVRKIRRFLGTDLSSSRLDTLTKQAEGLIRSRIEEMSVGVFDFSLTRKEISSLNKLDGKIEIVHFDAQQWEQFTERFIYDTNAIEGSTVLQEEVRPILDKRIVHTPDEAETKGVAKAISFIRSTELDLSLRLMLRLHKLCFEGSKPFAGNFRDVEVVIRDARGEVIHRGTPVEELDKELERFVLWYKKNKEVFDPLVLAAIVHNQFEDIHPFQDGNGRVGRLLLNFVLIRHGYPPINILLKDRTEYYSVLQDYQKNDRIRPTLHFLIRQYKKTLKQVTTKKQKR
ncbi:MAG: Fic family protein [archaeon]